MVRWGYLRPVQFLDHLTVIKIRFWKIQNFGEKKLGDFFLRYKWQNVGGDIMQEISEKNFMKKGTMSSPVIS